MLDPSISIPSSSLEPFLTPTRTSASPPPSASSSTTTTTAIMFLPTEFLAATTAFAAALDIAPGPSYPFLVPGYRPENWSSLIGIVTAIVGNVLISFALNLQRFAHLRLEKEARGRGNERERERLRKRGRERRGSSEYGAVGGEGGGAGDNGKFHPPRRRDIAVRDEREQDGGEEEEGDERQPLLGAGGNTSATRSRSKRSRKAASPDEEDPEQAVYKQKSYLRSPWWWAGIILMTTGEAGNFLAYGFAPASIVSPLGVVALVSNCIIAPIMLKEKFRSRDGLGVLVAISGAVTVVLSASDNNPKLGPEDIWGLITTWEFETYLGVTVAVIVGLMVASKKYGEKSILIDLGLVGLFGGYTALSTKGVASMLSYTLWRAVTFPVTYLLVAILVFTAIMQIKYINRALQRFDATQVIPVQFVLFTLSVILGSAILYRDFERTSGGDAGKFVGGCALTFAGVWLITSGRHQRRDADEENLEADGDASIGLVSAEMYHDEADEVYDDENGSSRRSSTVRAASPPIVIDQKSSTHEVHREIASQTPTSDRRPSHLSTHPPVARTPTANTPISPSPLITTQWARYTTPASSTPQNHPTPHPPLLARHTSSPILPSEATLTETPTALLSPNIPLSTPTLPLPSPSPHSPHTTLHLPPRPHTPIHRGHSDTFPQTPGAAPPRTPHRRPDSATGLLAPRNSLPGPLLASPLSSTLSAVVEGLKRGGSLRIPGTSMVGRGLVFEEEGEDGDEDGGVRERMVVEGTGTGRGRSLSGTLEELWRGVVGTSAVGGGGGGNAGVVEDGEGEEGEEGRRRSAV